MEREMFEKKLTFTVESVRNNYDNVSGVIDLGDGGCIVFDNDTIEYNDSEGVTIFSSYYNVLRIDEFLPVLRALNCAIVERVYPDCC